jgi:GNAT superfamily N-acetyltransferase
VNAPVIRFTDNSDPADAQELRDSLHSFNFATTGLNNGRGLSCFIRDADGRLVAGMDGFTWGGYARLEYLWVAADRRREGVGRQLVEAVIDEARARGCSTIIVATHSFQAPGFYEALGFVEAGRTTDTPLGYDEIVYQMRLDGHPE